MRKGFFIILILGLTISAAPGRVFSQTPVESVEQEPAATENQPQAEAPKKASNIEVKDGRLSVELVDAQFGSVMKEIAAKMNFQVDINNQEVNNRKITTKFVDLDFDRAIDRLFSLVREKNYLVRYDANGALSRIELYADNPTTSAGRSVSTTPARPVTQSPLSRRRFRRQPLTAQPAQPAPQPQAPPPAANPSEDALEE